MSDVLKMQAEKAAARVDATKVGFDPVTIITILTTVLPIIVKCFQKNDEPNAPMAAANLKRYNDRKPEELLRRTARRVRGEANEPMTKAESFELAKAVIAQGLEADDAVAAACYGEAASV